MTRENTISQQEATTIPDECLINGGVAVVYTNAVIDGERYLSGTAYCKRTPVLESQKPYELCPAAETCVLHKIESGIVADIISDSINEEKLKKQQQEINRAKASTFAFVM